MRVFDTYYSYKKKAWFHLLTVFFIFLPPTQHVVLVHSLPPRADYQKVSTPKTVLRTGNNFYVTRAHEEKKL